VIRRRLSWRHRWRRGWSWLRRVLAWLWRALAGGDGVSRAELERLAGELRRAHADLERGEVCIKRIAAALREFQEPRPRARPEDLGR